MQRAASQRWKLQACFTLYDHSPLCGACFSADALPAETLAFHCVSDVTLAPEAMLIVQALFYLFIHFTFIDQKVVWCDVIIVYDTVIIWRKKNVKKKDPGAGVKTRTKSASNSINHLAKRLQWLQSVQSQPPEKNKPFPKKMRRSSPDKSNLLALTDNILKGVFYLISVLPLTQTAALQLSWPMGMLTQTNLGAPSSDHVWLTSCNTFSSDLSQAENGPFRVCVPSFSSLCCATWTRKE